MTSPPLRLTVRNGPAVAHYPPGATLGPRVLPSFEFVWMLSGQASWLHLGGATPAGRRTLQPGRLLLSRPGLREFYEWDTDVACAHAYVSFYVEDSDRLGAVDSWPFTRDLSTADPMAALCRYLLALSGTDTPAGQARTVDALGWILDLFVNGPFPDDSDAVLPEHLTRLVEHLRATWRDDTCRPADLGELAAAARVSPGHLARLFRQQFSVGPVAAVELIRLTRAAILLQRSNLSIGAVSQTCGFANPFHFSRRFTLAHGMPPRTYRTSRPRDPLDPVRGAGLLPLARRLLVDDL